MWLSYFREFNTASIVLRLTIAFLFGGVIGLEREQRGRAAGLRTYILVAIGASLAMLLDQYYAERLSREWKSLNLSTDVSRLGAQVINGIGFLVAGTILITGRQGIKGLTTSAGLWASACAGLAIGAGYYECIALAFILMVISMSLLPAVESRFVAGSRNLNLYIEMESVRNIGDILRTLRRINVSVMDVDLDSGRDKKCKHSNVTLSMKLPKGMQRTQVLSELSLLDCILLIDIV